MTFRTDRNNNPTAMIVQMAAEGGLIEGVDYTQGDSFQSGTETFYTAKFLNDPIESTIKVIDKLGFYTLPPHARWTYIAIPFWLWISLDAPTKTKVIQFMYHQEGGTELERLFTK